MQTAWGVTWEYGWVNPPRMFEVSFQRATLQQRVGTSWTRNGETWQQGWKRAYRRGCRTVKISLAPLEDGK